MQRTLLLFLLLLSTLAPAQILTPPAAAPLTARIAPVGSVMGFVQVAPKIFGGTLTDKAAFAPTLEIAKERVGNPVYTAGGCTMSIG
jgi:hypothetical protein